MRTYAEEPRGLAQARFRTIVGAAPTAAQKVSGLSLPVVLAIAAIAANILVSANLLFALGIQYSAPGGNPLVKFHPGTYLAALSFLTMLWERRSPIVTLRQALRDEPLLFFYLAMMTCCLGFALVSNGSSGAGVYVESFMPAAFLGIVLLRSTPRSGRLVGCVLMALFLMNVLLVFVETALQTHFIPIYLGDRAMVEPPGEFRSAALYDHPLTAAQMTAMCVFLLLAHRSRPLARSAALVACLVGLLAIGGRTALVATVGALVLWGTASLTVRFFARRLTATDVAASVAAAIIVPATFAVLLATTSVGGRIAARFYWDESANERTIQWKILGLIDLRDALFGISYDRLAELTYQLGLRFPFADIENFWLLMFLNLGAAGYVFFLLGFFALLFRLWQFPSPAARAL
ncbi:MAG: VpsF family polysaccharide biosynthesis protein, partial [Alphaproteobacteria bacterium]|nr:VpsF family polysaccharide biosynthesis protein [Alphaproteobacteria bacterium]